MTCTGFITNASVILSKAETHEETIYAEPNRLLTDQEAFDSMAHASNPYGDGRACERIADILENLI